MIQSLTQWFIKQQTESKIAKQPLNRQQKIAEINNRS